MLCHTATLEVRYKPHDRQWWKPGVLGARAPSLLPWPYCGSSDRGRMCPASVLPFSRIFPFNSLGPRKLKTRLQHLRWSGTKNTSQENKEKSCARCQRVLGLLLNRGTACQGCSYRVCSECRVFLRRTHVWRCTGCFEDR